MATSKTIRMEIGYEDDGTIIFANIDKENIQLVRKALAYLYKQEQSEKTKMRILASTCRNCKFSQPRNRYDNTLTCTKKIVHKYHNKVVRPTESCKMFERKED
jgi:hypothetical protein